ncbi:urease accessory protein UreH [Chloroflexota bacterium]
MSQLVSTLVLGFILGLKHAFDPDHLVAVSTIVSEYRNPLRAIWIGVSWGLGHTTTLLLLGLLILLLKISLPEKLALSFEFLVGIVLVLLGLQIFWNLRRSKVHLHRHQHQSEAHVHLHSHSETPEHHHHLRLRWNNFAQFLIAGIIPGEHPQDKLKEAVKPFFRVKSYLVGIVHGLAGSASLMLLVLVNMESTWAGVVYIIIFGIGSVLAMGVVTIFLTIPFSLSSKLPRLNLVVQSAAATLGIVFGILLMYDVGVRNGLLI